MAILPKDKLKKTADVAGKLTSPALPKPIGVAATGIKAVADKLTTGQIPYSLGKAATTSLKDKVPQFPKIATGPQPSAVTPKKVAGEPPPPEIPDKKTQPKKLTDVAVDEAVGDKPVPTDVPTTGAPVPTDEVKEDVEKAAAGVIETKEELKTTFDESLDVTMKTAEDRYNAENAAYNESLALQQQLAAQQQTLLTEGAEIQKQEAKNAYDANQAAITLQKKKVAEAYEQMQEEQKLLNTQRQVREETSLGLIYGGFGSVAANKNLEETVIKGERELMGLKKEAINKDTEFQNQVVDLNKAYELDVRKIEQWKAEESNKIYASLSGYVQEIKNNKAMSAVERSSAINQAVADYNTKVAEISASVAQTKYDLSIELMNRADRLKQQDIQNQIVKAQEGREVETFEYNQKRTVINNARTDLDLLLTNYFKEDYATLPPDVLASIDRLEKEAGLPSGASQQLMKMAKENEIKQGDVTKEFTNDLTGEVSVVKYNFGTGKVETMKLGEFGDKKEPAQAWTKVGEDEGGNIVRMNEITGEIRREGQYSGASGTPFDALAVPDGSHGGQCGRFVNQYTGLGMGDSYESKIGKMDPTIAKPRAGMVFVMPYRNTGHTGFIVSIEGNVATVKDSNYYINSDPEKVRTHQIPIAQMTGFLNVMGKKGEQEPKETEGTEETKKAEGVEETKEESGYTPLFK